MSSNWHKNGCWNWTSKRDGCRGCAVNDNDKRPKIFGAARAQAPKRDLPPLFASEVHRKKLYRTFNKINTRENEKCKSSQQHLTMSTITGTKKAMEVKTLECKIRPYGNANTQERPDQKTLARVYLSTEALRELGLSPGMPCFLWKVNEISDRRRSAIIWNTTEKQLSKKVVQMTKTFREATGFNLGDDIKICAGKTVDIKLAESIVLRDVTSEDTEGFYELPEEDKTHWEWYLKENLRKSKHFTNFVASSAQLLTYIF